MDINRSNEVQNKPRSKPLNNINRVEQFLKAARHAHVIDVCCRAGDEFEKQRSTQRLKAGGRW